MKNRIQIDTSLEQWFQGEIDAARKTPEFHTEKILLKLAGQISEHLKRNKISQTSLASDLGVSKGWVSRLINNPPNMSIEKYVEIAFALGLQFDANLSEPNIDIQKETLTCEIFNLPYHKFETLVTTMADVSSYSCIDRKYLYSPSITESFSKCAETPFGYRYAMGQL